MDLRETGEDAAFRAEIRDWLEHNLGGEFARIRGRGGPGDEAALFDERLAWERHLGASGWIGIGWPKESGGRGLSLWQQVIFHEEYARARGPGRVGHIGETLVAPTLIEYGTDAQRERFLPGILEGTALWCQGYSEPDAGSDLANVATRAVLDGDEWRIDGQKVWTSLAHWADWCFVLARTNPDAPKHRGLSYLLVPMRQPGIDVRPIVQLTHDSEFNEVFFTGARTARDNVVGEVDGGWKVAMGTLAFERGASTLGQQHGFENELACIVDDARRRGGSPALRARMVDAWIGLRIMRWSALRTLAGSEHGELSPAATVSKLFWSSWHRRLGELAIDVAGADALVGADSGATHALTAAQRLFLFSRADTIYGGSNQVQRNVIGERALGLAKEPA